VNDKDVSHALGMMQGTVQAMSEQWREQERTATAGRRAVHDKLEELGKAQGVTSTKLGHLTDEFAEIKPAVKRFEAQRQRSEGGRSMVKLLWGGLLAFLAGLGYAAHDLLGFFWPPKH
jgi:hypothetical protein